MTREDEDLGALYEAVPCGIIVRAASGRSVDRCLVELAVRPPVLVEDEGGTPCVGAVRASSQHLADEQHP